MSDGSELQATDGKDKTVIYRPADGGGLQAVAPESGDYRDDLRSRRWNAAPLANPEVEKTDPRIAAAVIVIFSLITLAILVVGYGVLGVWDLPT